MLLEGAAAVARRDITIIIIDNTLLDVVPPFAAPSPCLASPPSIRWTPR